MKLNKSVLLLVALAFTAACTSTKKATVENTKPVIEETSVQAPALYHASDPMMHDLIHTRLDVSFDWMNKQLLGSAEITLKPHFYPQDMLYLDARGMKINEVKLMNGISKSDLQYEYRNDSICIKLDRLYSAKDTFKVYVNYIARPETLKKGGSQAITDDKGLYFINADGKDPKKPTQVWTQGETQSSSVWFPTIDRPNQKTTEEIYITVDTAYVTLSNGKMISSVVNKLNGTRTDYWRQTLPHAPYLFMMAVGKYAVVKDLWRGKEVSYYVEPAYEKFARGIFANTPEMLEFFSNRFGVEYAWDKYAQVVVRDYVSGAMENTSATIMGEFVQKDDRALYDASNDDIVSHELSHHWFGDLLTCESWSNLPLNESFATYCEYLWNEHKYGRDEADWSLNGDLKSYLQEARTKQVDLVRFDYNDKEDMFDRHTYQKGGRILHMLRKEVGDDAFFASLKLYLEKNKFTSVEAHQLRLAFESVTGKDLNWFFNQWFYDKGHPILKINYDYNVQTGVQSVTVEQQQDFKKTPLYRLPVVIDIYTSIGKESKQVVISQQKETFEFKVSEKPMLVNFDAEKMLLCTKTDNHTDEEFAYMFRHAPLVMDRYESLLRLTRDSKMSPLAADVCREALNDPFWGIRSSALRNCRSIASSVKSKMMVMGKSDPKPSVRNDALDVLAISFPKDNEVLQLMESLVSDSSYKVMQTTISYIIDNDPVKGLSMAKSLEKQDNDNIRAILNILYMKSGGDEQYPFMTSALNESSGMSKYGAVQNYGKFLLRCNAANAMSGLNAVAQVGYSDPQWFIRLAATQALSEIAKTYGKASTSATSITQPGSTVLNDRAAIESENVRKKAEELVSDIKSKETDPNLTRIYAK